MQTTTTSSSSSLGKSMEVAVSGKGISPSSKYMERPSRKQIPRSAVAEQPAPDAANQGTFNIWYYKTPGDRPTTSKIRAVTRCHLDRDAGYTMADKTNRVIFCLSFARGCCGVGHECNYLHRIPGPEDEKYFTPLYDCFGRDKHMVDRYDMGGTGAFSRENRTLYIGGISAMTEDIENTVRNHFSDWGEIESIKILPRKYVAFVKYVSRLNAEYAKEAMFGQSLGNNEILNVRWSTVDPNPKVKAELQREHEITFAKAFLENKSQESLTAYEMYDREEEQEAKLLEMAKRRKLENLGGMPTLVASAYPNTDYQFKRDLYSITDVNSLGAGPHGTSQLIEDPNSHHKETSSMSGRASSISLLVNYDSDEDPSTEV